MLSSTFPMPMPVRDTLFVVAAVSCIVAQFFILRAVWRVVPSVTGSPSVPAPRRASEMAWAILPTLLIVAAFAGAWRVMHPTTSLPAAPVATAGPVAQGRLLERPDTNS